MRLPSFSPRMLPQVLDAYADSPTAPIEGIKTLLEVDDAGANALVEAAKLLELIREDDSFGEIASLIRTASLVERRELIRFYVERFPPYAE
jgi:hypothetical protein